MKLVISTQYRENYGAHDWDGKGECPQYWKNKHGSFYHFTNFEPDLMNVAKQVNSLAVAAGIEKNDDYQQEFIVDWFVESDDYVSPDEQIQLDYASEDPVFHYDERIDCKTLVHSQKYRGYDYVWRLRTWTENTPTFRDLEEKVLEDA